MKDAALRKLREKVGSQLRAAQLLGVHWTTVSRWENGHQQIPDEKLRQLRDLAENPPPVADPVTAVSISTKGRCYEVTVTSSSGARTITTPGVPLVRITGDVVEITPAERKAKR